MHHMNFKMLQSSGRDHRPNRRSAALMERLHTVMAESHGLLRWIIGSILLVCAIVLGGALITMSCLFLEFVFKGSGKLSQYIDIWFS